MAKGGHPLPLAGTPSEVTPVNATKVRSWSLARGHDDRLPVADRFEAPRVGPSSAMSRRTR